MAMGDAWVEVVDGESVDVEISVGLLRAMVAENLKDVLRAHARANGLGAVLPGGVTYILAEDETGVQLTHLPDVSLIRHGRLPANFGLTCPFPGRQDLAIEVTSPGQTVAALCERVRNYLAHGADEVCGVAISTRELPPYHRAHLGIIPVRGETDAFTPADLFPGQSITIADLFNLSAFHLT